MFSAVWPIRLYKKMQQHKIFPLVTGIVISFGVLLICYGIGSASISMGDAFRVLLYQLFGARLPEHISPSQVSILWSIRLPRVLMAFFVGGALSVSGAVMQSVLQNPLASSYTLGVSSGASLGASIALAFLGGVPVLGSLSMPVFGFAFGLGTVLLVIAISSRLDYNVQSSTIILFGMVISLFVNALLTLVESLNHEYMQRILMWQMGSFSGRRWFHVEIVAPVAVIGLVFLACFHRELDILSFGDEQSMALGVNSRVIKRVLLVVASLMTGAAVCFSGTIGFVDLITPHMVRKVYGASHWLLLPLSLLYGGSFMVIADTVARTIISPREIAVGAVTALIGAPFFIWLYFRKRDAG